MNARVSFSFSILLASFSLLVSLTGATEVKIDLIYEICNKTSQESSDVSYSFCVNSLKAVPSSKHASLKILGLISMKLTQQGLTHTHFYIKKLLRQHKYNSKYYENCLKECKDLYSDAKDNLREATWYYRTMHYSDANILVSSVMDAASTCEDDFSNGDFIKSPLTKMNNDLHQLAAIDLSIIEMLRNQ